MSNKNRLSFGLGFVASEDWDECKRQEMALIDNVKFISSRLFESYGGGVIEFEQFLEYKAVNNEQLCAVSGHIIVNDYQYGVNEDNDATIKLIKNHAL